MIMFSSVMSFPSPVCVCTDFTGGFTHTLFKNHTQIRNSHFEVLSCASAMLTVSGPTVGGSPGSRGDTLSWLLLFLCWCLGIWAWDGCDSGCHLCWVSFLILGFCCPPHSLHSPPPLDLRSVPWLCIVWECMLLGPERAGAERMDQGRKAEDLGGRAGRLASASDLLQCWEWRAGRRVKITWSVGFQGERS